METVAAKPKSYRALYVEVLRTMPPEERLSKAFELTDMTRELLKAGLAKRHPSATTQQLEQLYLERLERCRSRTF